MRLLSHHLVRQQLPRNQTQGGSAVREGHEQARNPGDPAENRLAVAWDRLRTDPARLSCQGGMAVQYPARLRQERGHCFQPAR